MAHTGIEQLKRTTYFKAMDYWLLVPVLCITLIGLYNLNIVIAQRFEASYPAMFYRQAGAALVGLSLALLISTLEVPTLRLLGWLIYAVSLMLLVYVLVDDFSMEDQWGADRWLNLPLVGSFQPSELTKIGLAMVGAHLFEAMNEKQIRVWQGALALLAVFMVPILLILRQPDFSTSMVVVFMFLCMLFIWGLRWRYILLGMSAAVVMLPLAWFFYFQEYQKNRIITFLYPGHDPDATYNIIQSRLAIASGGIAGSTREVPVHVPVKESDFIFAAIAENMGFIGAAALLALVFFFLARIFYVASKVQGLRVSSALMLSGLGAALAFHFIENIGMSVGLLPVTGVPLPFASHGGTAMVTNYIGLGIMLCISMERNQQQTRQ